MPSTFTLDLPAGHLDLELCVNSGQVFRWRREPSGAWFGVDGGHWYRVRAPEGDPARPRDARIDVEREYRPGVDTFRIETNGKPDDFTRLFRLDWDAATVEAEIVRRGPELKPYVAAMRGLRLLRPQSATEILFTFMCTPNNHLARIGTMVRHLATCGEVIDEVGGEPVYRFPTTEAVAGTSPEALRANGFGYRANTIPTAAQYLLDRGGDAYIESLRHVSYEEAHHALLAVPFIGRKLADCIALFGLDQTSALPIDTHLWQAATRLYFPKWRDTSLTDLKYRQTSAFVRARFQELTGWAQQSLFLDNVLNWRSRNLP